MGLMTDSLMPAREGIFIFVKVLPWLQNSGHSINFVNSAGSKELWCSFNSQVLFLVGNIFVRIRYSDFACELLNSNGEHLLLPGLYQPQTGWKTHILETMETVLCKCLVQPASPFLCPISEFVMHPKISDDLKQTTNGSFSATGKGFHMFTWEVLSQVPVLVLLLDSLLAVALESRCLGWALSSSVPCSVYCGGNPCRENSWVGKVTEP